MAAASPLAPVLAVALSMALLSTMDAMVKGLGASHGVWQIVVLRYGFGLLFALPAFLPHLRRGITRASLLANGLRGAIFLITGASFFYSLTRLPLAEAVTFAFTAPLWTVVLARVLLGEAIEKRALVAVALGLAGVLVVTSDQLFGDRPFDVLGVAAALLASLGYATAIVLLRQQASRDPVPVLVALQTAAALMGALPLGIASWTPLSAPALLAFLFVGALGTAGHLFLSWGFARAPAGKLAPLEYTSFLWAAFYGHLFFGEEPTAELAVGAALIITAAFIASRHRPAAAEPVPAPIPTGGRKNADRPGAG
jgi:drug/metabolite transporter (DMT)-like permease